MEAAQTYTLSYRGSGSSLFRIQIVNLILTVITLGLYYPWAKARTLEYLYGQSHFEDSPFSFTGTGKEMFKGFIKVILILLGIYAVAGVLGFLVSPVLALIWFYVAFFVLFPLAIHGSYKYRMAKTTWRGIRFGYTGDRTELIKLCVKGILLTIVTIGFYGAWFAMDLRRYLISNVKVGNASFSYHGQGSDFFWLNFKGYFFTLFTLGIYSFWWQRNLFRYFIDHIELTHGEHKVYLQSTATVGGIFVLTIVNMLILIFTLGLGFPWVITRNLRFVTENITFSGNISLEELQQEQPDFSNATGEDMADFFDFGFVF